jgi:hypothetical protein
MEPELAKIVAILVTVAVGAAIVLSMALLVARRRLEKGWQATQKQRVLLFDRLKTQGLLVHKFVETAHHRLVAERESLEVLGRRQTKVAAGRTPPEKAAATIELNNHLEQLISIADNDPGLYNETVDAYNRQASGIFGRFFGSLRAEKFDASKQNRGANRV